MLIQKSAQSHKLNKTTPKASIPIVILVHLRLPLAWERQGWVNSMFSKLEALPGWSQSILTWCDLVQIMGGFVQHGTLVPKDIESHALGKRDTKKKSSWGWYSFASQKNRQEVTGIQPQQWERFIVNKRRDWNNLANNKLVGFKFWWKKLQFETTNWISPNCSRDRKKNVFPVILLVFLTFHFSCRAHTLFHWVSSTSWIFCEGSKWKAESTPAFQPAKSKGLLTLFWQFWEKSHPGKMILWALWRPFNSELCKGRSGWGRRKTDTVFFSQFFSSDTSGSTPLLPVGRVFPSMSKEVMLTRRYHQD